MLVITFINVIFKYIYYIISNIQYCILICLYIYMREVIYAINAINAKSKIYSMYLQKGCNPENVARNGICQS